MEFSVADAGAFYQQVPPKESISALRWLVKRLEKEHKVRTVSVKKGLKAMGWLGGQASDYVNWNASVLVFWFWEVQLVYATYIVIAWVRVGDHIMQVLNTSIGSPLGRIAVALVTGRLEQLPP